MMFSNFCVLLILLQSSFIVTDPTTTIKIPDTPSTTEDTSTEQTTKMTTNEPDLTTPTMTPTTDSNGNSTVSYSTIQIETTLSDALTKSSSYQTKGNILISIVTSVVVIYFSQIY